MTDMYIAWIYGIITGLVIEWVIGLTIDKIIERKYEK